MVISTKTASCCRYRKHYDCCSRWIRWYRVYKIQKFSSLLNLEIPQKTSFYEHRRQYVFPEINAAWRKNQLEQIEEIKSSGLMLELALDGQCHSQGYNLTCDTVSAKDTATNKLINFRVVHVKLCNYLNETTHYVSFCDFCILRTQSQYHNTKTTLKPNRNCDIYLRHTNVLQVYYTFLRGIVHLNGRQNFMWCNACFDPWNIKNIFLANFSYRKALFVGIQIKIPENTFHFLKCQGIKINF